jgi:phosphoribosylglycinamide formyltransferase-1
MDRDSEEALSKRILAQEHKLYPRAIKLIAEKIDVKGRKAMLI